MVVTNYLLTGMILQVGNTFPETKPASLHPENGWLEDGWKFP